MVYECEIIKHTVSLYEAIDLEVNHKFILQCFSESLEVQSVVIVQHGFIKCTVLVGSCAANHNA